MSAWRCSEDTAAAALSLFEKGYSIGEIARLLDRSAFTIERIIREVEKVMKQK